jgi:3-isopropylmalate dehydratase small subunit
MTQTIRGKAHILGDDVNTDLNCSSKYLPGRDNAYIAQHAFDKLVPGFPGRVKPGDVVVAGKNFGINSSREQAVHVLRTMGIAAIVAPSFGRQFFRNAINNGLPVIECDVTDIAQDDEIEVDAAKGRVAVPRRKLSRSVSPLPAEVQAILAAGGLIAFLQKHPNWELG